MLDTWTNIEAAFQKTEFPSFGEEIATELKKLPIYLHQIQENAKVSGPRKRRQKYEKKLRATIRRLIEAFPTAQAAANKIKAVQGKDREQRRLSHKTKSMRKRSKLLRRFKGTMQDPVLVD